MNREDGNDHPEGGASPAPPGDTRPTPDGGSDEMVETRHRIHRTIRQAMERHPAVLEARGIPDGRYAEVEAVVDPSFFGRDASKATIRVSWQPGAAEHRHPACEDWGRPERVDSTAHFVFHYSDTGGYDCGYHCEPNPHVDGLLHVQQRPSADDEYAYEPASLDASSPVGILWEVLAALETRLGRA